MDITILIAIAAGLLILLVFLYFFQKKSEPKDEKPPANRGVPMRAADGVARRAQMARNQRNRLRQNAQAAAVQQQRRDASDNEDGSDDGEEPISHNQVLTDEKMGAKKRAKMEAKEQKRLMREQELQMREEKKVKDAKLEEERKLVEERLAEEERKQAEAERLAKEAKERQEYEEYLKMKEAFSVEEEGFEEGEEEQNTISDFVQFIKNNKVVVLEDLASEFKLKTQKAIERIQELQENGTLTGVIDDRGKFIYVSEEELAAVAKFIKQRGRVSITELAESSNNLINLTPIASE